MPRRPKSKLNYTKLLLKSINPTNKYVLNPSLPLPDHLISPTSESDEILDEKNGILSISLSCKAKLSNQCFITFNDHSHAMEFMNEYNSKLKVNGNVVEIQWAKKESLLSLSLQNKIALEKALKNRKLQKELAHNESLRKNQKLKRYLRRLRHKLRAKGQDEEEISKIIAIARVEKYKTYSHIEKSVPKKLPTDKVINEKKKVTSTVENPPNKILLVQDLPEDATQESIGELFNGDGLLEVRYVEVRHLAFVEYDSISHASDVKNKLGSPYDWKGTTISIGFAK